MTQPFLRFFFFSLLLPLSACSISQSYPTVALTNEFSNRAFAIQVKAPVRRYSDKFFNVSLGDYTVEKTQFSDPRKSEREYVKQKKFDTTGWNILLQGQLIPEKKTYKQYKVVSQRDFSFEINNPQGADIKADCRYASSFLENEEAQRLTLIVGATKKRNPGAEVNEIGKWLETALKCNLQQGNKQWQLAALERVDAPEIIKIQRAGNTYHGERLQESYSETAGTGGSFSDVLYSSNTGELSGVAFFDAGVQVAAVSLTEGNNTIWSAQPLSKEEQEMMLGVGYSLILASWRGLNESLL